MARSELLKAQLEKLPNLPGVYLMKNAEGEIIYVGKAKNLKNRVRSYFRDPSTLDLKTATLSIAIRDFDYFIVSNESEAFFLEANLIKRHQPRFNILLKDDKFYPYIVVTAEHFPLILMTRNTALFPGAKIYGPYTIAEHTNAVVDFLNLRFKLRTCTRNMNKRSSRPCLNYSIEQCSAPCAGMISEDDYNRALDEAESLLAKITNGALTNAAPTKYIPPSDISNTSNASELPNSSKSSNTPNTSKESNTPNSSNSLKRSEFSDAEEPAKISEISKIFKKFGMTPIEVLHEVEYDMQAAADALDFERAIELRGVAAALRGLSVKQRVLSTDGKNQDYIAGDIEGDKACAMLFQYRDGKLIDREEYTLLGAEGMNESQLVEAFIKQYYTGSENIPNEILLSVPVDDMDGLATAFTEMVSFKVSLETPEKGDKKRLVELVKKNATEYLKRFELRIEKEFEQAALVEKELRELLDLPAGARVQRFEAFDISNTSGVHSVGSMVTFEGGKKKKQHYRRYRIKTVDGPDDYASMQEVVFRRYRRNAPDFGEPGSDTSGSEAAGSQHENTKCGAGSNRAGVSSKNASTDILPLPDIVLIDGGKGHVNAVEKVLAALGISVPVVGMVKDDAHRTRDLVYRGRELGLKQKKNAYKFIYGVQEEVHRFAINYHRDIRSKAMLSTELAGIRGVGEKTKIRLMRHFKSIRAIATATVDELLECKGLKRSQAEAIREHFDKDR